MDGSQGNGGPIPPCPFLLRKSKFTHAKVAKAGTGDEGIRDSGAKGGTNPSLSDSTTSRSRGTSKGWEDRDIFSRKGR